MKQCVCMVPNRPNAWKMRMRARMVQNRPNTWNWRSIDDEEGSKNARKTARNRLILQNTSERWNEIPTTVHGSVSPRKAARLLWAIAGCEILSHMSTDPLFHSNILQKSYNRKEGSTYECECCVSVCMVHWKQCVIVLRRYRNYYECRHSRVQCIVGKTLVRAHACALELSTYTYLRVVCALKGVCIASNISHSC